MAFERVCKAASALIVATSLAASLTGCSTFRVVREGKTEYPPSTAVEVVWQRPTRPFVVVARFNGTEQRVCAKDRPYCSLYKDAMRLGANAIWVQQRTVHERPGQWFTFQNQLRYLPPSRYEEVRGVMLYYTR